MPDPCPQKCAPVNTQRAWLSKEWAPTSSCSVIPSKLMTTQVYSRSTHEVNLVIDFLSKFKGTPYQLHLLRARTEGCRLYYIDTAVTGDATTTGSVKRVGVCAYFHQACTSSRCETPLVDLGLSMNYETNVRNIIKCRDTMTGTRPVPWGSYMRPKDASRAQYKRDKRR
ncbi:hypothetical protein H4582DRAFT_2008406 [Lactarius indigo]|nr:hypothetical protein H4582DRAFT_2008406 [Lactarius indigo]